MVIFRMEWSTTCSRWLPGWARVFQGLFQNSLPVGLYYLDLLIPPPPLKEYISLLQ